MLRLQKYVSYHCHHYWTISLVTFKVKFKSKMSVYNQLDSQINTVEEAEE